MSFKVLISAFDQNVIRHLIDIGMTAKRHTDINQVTDDILVKGTYENLKTHAY